LAAKSGLRFEPIGPAVRAEVAEFLATLQAIEPHFPFTFSEENGYPGLDGYIEFWRALSTDVPPIAGLAKTDTLLPMRGGRVLGELRVRHWLTSRLEVEGGHIGYVVRGDERNRGVATAMLREGLRRAAALGLERALLTVRTTNAASLRVVAKCGGVMHDEVPEGSVPINRRFWLSTRD